MVVPNFVLRDRFNNREAHRYFRHTLLTLAGFVQWKGIVNFEEERYERIITVRNTWMWIEKNVLQLFPWCFLLLRSFTAHTCA